MNAEDVTQKLNYIQQANALTLNVEERAALQSSLLILKRNGKFNKLVFWGKIYGLKKDYLIVQGFGENLLKQKKTFCSYNGVEWVQLPDITAQNEAPTRELCKKIRGRFMGDLSHEYFVDVMVMVDPSQANSNTSKSRRKDEGSDEESDEEEDEEEAESPPAKTDNEPREQKVRRSVTEEKRLAHIIACIDCDAATVPRGALHLDACHCVSVNPIFEGLKGPQATQLRSYCHFREPITAKKRSLLQKEGLSATLDFLDTLDEDIPRGCWSLQEDKYMPQITLRNLLWPGFYFYHVPSTSNHGYVYFGFGEKNTDLGFML